VLAPETLDVRSDLYQLGAIAYYLLVGHHVFRGESSYDVLAQHVGVAPEAPSAALGRALSPDLERLVLRCLEKDPGSRPANAGELLAELERCRVAGSWGQRDAHEWWERWWKSHPPEVEDSASPSSHPSGHTIDVVERLRRRS